MANRLGVVLTVLPVLISAAFYDSVFPDGYSRTNFGSKTAYENNGLRPTYLFSNIGKRLIHANVIFRHGTRSPSLKFIDKMVTLRDKLIERLPRNWSLPLNSRRSSSKTLLPKGVDDFLRLGQRFRHLLAPDELRTAESTKCFISPTERTKESAKHFISQFYEDPASVKCEVDTARLRFFDNCDRYSKAYNKNKSLLVEYYKFMDGPEMTQVLQEVVQDNGLEDLGLTTKDLVDLYTMAGHETSALESGDPVSGWVRMFRPLHLFVLEYLHDIKHYWRKANPFPINYEQVCPLLGSVLRQLADSARHDLKRGSQNPDKVASPPQGVYWFAHAETILPLVIKLGLFNESIKSDLGGGDFLRADGFPARAKRLASSPPVANLFRASHIIPFAANLAFLLYHCPIDGEKPSLNDYCLEVQLNEQPVHIIPEIQERPLRFSTVLQRFKGCQSENFNHSALCDLPVYDNFLKHSEL